MLAQVNPAGYFKAAALSMKTMKTKHSPDIAMILEETADMLSGNQDASSQASEAAAGQSKSSRSPLSQSQKLPQNTNENKSSEDIMAGPILKSVATLAEPFTPVIKSTLDEVIHKLPDDWKMKEQSIPNALKKASNALTGKGLKDEEITMSGIIDPTSTAVITKKDLLARPRKDQFTQTTLKEGNTRFSDVTLKEFRSPTYEEKIRRFNLGGEKTRKISTSRSSPSHTSSLPK